MVPQVVKHLAIGLLMTLMTVSLQDAGATGSIHKRFIIHVPLKMKTHHHTHTVYTHIHHGGGKVEYKVLGYSLQGLEKHGVHGSAHDEIGPIHGTTGDIVFNHYSRNNPVQLNEEVFSDYEDLDP